MEKGQSKWRSFLEANVNTIVGFTVTLVASPIIYNLVGMKYNFQQLSLVTLFFTLLSVIRGYIIRRFFNIKEKKKDKHLIQQIDDLKNPLESRTLFAEQWKRTYESTRKRLSAFMKEKLDFIAYIDDQSYNKFVEYQHNELVQKNMESIHGIINQIQLRDVSIKKLEEELDMCKHLHTAAVSDLVEGADYYSQGIQAKHIIEEDADNSESNS